MNTDTIAATVDRMLAAADKMVTTTVGPPAPAGSTATRERRTAIVDHRHTHITTSAEHRRYYETTALPEAVALKVQHDATFTKDHERGEHDGIYIGSCPSCRSEYAQAQGRS